MSDENTISQQYSDASLRQIIEDDFDEMFAIGANDLVDMDELYGGAPRIDTRDLAILATPEFLAPGEARQFAISLMTDAVEPGVLHDAAQSVLQKLPRLLSWIDEEVACAGMATKRGNAARLFHIVEQVAAIETLFAQAGLQDQFLIAARWFHDAARRHLGHVRGFGYDARPDNPEAWLMLAPVYAVCLAIAIDRRETTDI